MWIVFPLPAIAPVQLALDKAVMLCRGVSRVRTEI